MEVDRSTLWPYKDGEPGEFIYQRYGHPTGVEAERRLGELDGGHALLFSSGAGATTALVLALLSSGDTIALAEGAYFGTGVIFRDLERWGLRLVEFDQTGTPPDGVDLVWLEAPSNPFLTMPDLEAAAAHPARVVVDATAATPIYLRPLEHGADFVLHSATKYLGGHDNVLLGVVVSKREEDAQRLLGFRTRSGIVAAPDPCALLLQGLDSLESRVHRQTESAIELAQRLAAHPAVAHVRYPGFGGLLSFDVAGAAEARHVETSLRLITNATSLGGIHSLLEARARWEGDRVPPGLLRLSVGLEPVEELWGDLAQALEIPGNFHARK
ncbi:MAG: cystathionine gamma-synthase [Gaiellaceae bacterium]|nr:cystathionine gamma-synthase [Gaiellaceae bacterium]MDX6388179.1 cystathionine gamma-synthase [Gaiellaceae bacterium]